LSTGALWKKADIRLRTYICIYFLKYSSLFWNVFEKCFLKDVHHNLWENILHFTRKTLNATIFPRYLTKKDPVGEYIRRTPWN